MIILWKSWLVASAKQLIKMEIFTSVFFSFQEEAEHLMAREIRDGKDKKVDQINV